jgi:hypothetical protein
MTVTRSLTAIPAVDVRGLFLPDERGRGGDGAGGASIAARAVSWTIDSALANGSPPPPLTRRSRQPTIGGQRPSRLDPKGTFRPSVVADTERRKNHEFCSTRKRLKKCKF